MKRVEQVGKDAWKADCTVCGKHALSITWKSSPCGGAPFFRCWKCLAQGNETLRPIGLRLYQVYGNSGLANGTYPWAARSRAAGLRGSELPSVERVVAWSSALQREPRVLAWLLRERGITAETAKKLFFGWDAARRRLTIPVFERGRLVQLYWYSPRSHPKLLASRGASRSLYVPTGRIRPDGEVVVCEGELDAALAWQLGFAAVGRPGASMRWRDEWTCMLRGRHVALVYDCDDAGRNAAARDATALNGYAVTIRRVDLRLAHGQDLTDLVVRYKVTAESFHAKVLRAAVEGFG
jgi:hypothetical protein